MRRALAAPGLVALAIAALIAAALTPAQSTTAEVPVPTCVKPTSNVTNLKVVTYAECLQARTEALITNALAPTPETTETPTPTPTPTPSPTPTPEPTPTPTPEPTGELNGWDLTTTNVGLTPLGLSCASLPEYTGPSEVPAGTTISGKRVTKQLDVSAGSIVIEKSCMKPTAANVGLVEGYYPQGDITIKDSEFDGSLVPDADRDSACAFTGGANLLRNYIHDVGSGICMVSSTNTRDQGETPHDILVKNNYVHRHTSCCGAHHEAATIRDFVQNAANDRTMKWVGNWLDITQTEYVSGGMFIQPTFEPIYNIWLEGNVFAGEGFNLVAGDSTAVNVVRNLHVVNNRFKPGTREYYGPKAMDTAGVAEWVDNHMFDSTQPEARGAVVTP
jgi:hypothetical protein